MTPTIDRRQLIAAAAIAAASAPVQAASAPDPAPAAFAVQPLPFDPKTIPGLSEKLLVSHHDNNYAGAVRRLSAITAQTRTLDPATAPVFQINGLKREELIAWNSMILHELYFASLAPRSGGPGGRLMHTIEESFGSETRWRAEFAGIGKALGGGSGWVLLTWSPRDRRLVNQWASDHTQVLAGSSPILALDMYEHAYHMDYGSNAGAYVDAFMKVINWGAVDTAFSRASA